MLTRTSDVVFDRVKLTKIDSSLMGVMSVSTLRQGQYMYDLVMFFNIDSRILKLNEWKKTVTV